MRALERIRSIESLIGSSNANYNVAYEYDDNERIIKETTTGSINSVTSYEYDLNDNIVKEIHIEGKNKTIKTYEYNANGQITSVDYIVEKII